MALDLEGLEERNRQLENRMVQLEKLLELQGTINGRLIETMNRLLLRVASFEGNQTQSSLILPERLNS